MPNNTASKTPAGIRAEYLGNARILATTGARRSPTLPDVPTFRESGYDIRELRSGVYGINLDPNFKNAQGQHGAHFDGVAVTYAQIAMKPALHAARLRPVRVAGILHCQLQQAVDRTPDNRPNYETMVLLANDFGSMIVRR